jgi:hypothetical protein
MTIDGDLGERLLVRRLRVRVTGPTTAGVHTWDRGDGGEDNGDARLQPLRQPQHAESVRLWHGATHLRRPCVPCGGEIIPAIGQDVECKILVCIDNDHDCLS